MTMSKRPLVAAVLALSIGATACSEPATSITAPSATSSAAKQKTAATPTELVQGILEVQVALLALSVPIQIGDVTIQDLINLDDVVINVFDLVDVQNVLNNNDIDILNIRIGNITIDDVLTNVLRDADILNKNQVVVGILSGGQVVIQNVNAR